MPITAAVLKLSTSRKVSPHAHPERGSYIKNCFSLPAGRQASCPGATDACDPNSGGYCYAGRDERRFPSVRRLVEHNFALLADCRTQGEMVALLDEAVKSFVKVATKKNLPLLFRLHEDGDFFSVTYAKAWATVVKANPDVQFWAYTRSYTKRINVVPHLAGIANLALYVSVDTHNRELAETRADEWKILGVKTAIIDTKDEAQETSIELLGRRSPICPEIAGKVPLVNDRGVGACITCGLCIVAKQPIIFPVHR